MAGEARAANRRSAAWGGAGSRRRANIKITKQSQFRPPWRQASCAGQGNGTVHVAGCAGRRVAIFARTARRAVIDPFRAADCGNDCDTIAGQPDRHRLARIFGRPPPAAPRV